MADLSPVSGPPGRAQPKAQRRRQIARLLAEYEVTSQHVLAELLAAEGRPAAQATVSRDLEEMGAVKVRRNGQVVYALPSPGGPGTVARPAGEALRRLLADSVGSVESTGALVVIRTPPGHAGMVASAIDRDAIEGIAGTLAGDDTVLVVCREEVPARSVEAWLRDLAGL